MKTDRLKQKCPVCGKPKHNLKQHVRMAHPETKVLEVAKPIPLVQETSPQARPKFRLWGKVIPPTLTPSQTPTVQATKVIKVGGRKWGLVGSGVILLVVGIGGFAFYSQTLNTFVGMVAVFVLLGGGFLTYYGLKKNDSGVIITRDGKLSKIKANSVNIYPDHIAYEDLPADQLLGQPRRCRNDGKYYYVHIQYEVEQKLKQFILPDSTYGDPREFAGCLNIPAHRALAQHSASTLQKIAPFAIVAGIGIMAFLFITMTPPAG